MRFARASLCLAASLFTIPAASAQTFRAEPSTVIGFGGAAAIAGDEILIGRPGTLVGFPIPPSHAGAVHIFRRAGERWAESGTLAAKDSAPGDGFGTALAADGNLLAVGAPSAGDGGAVYLYERGPGGEWTERTRLVAPNSAEGDRLGSSVALKGGVLLAGTPGRESGRGGVAVFHRGKNAGEWSFRGVMRGSGTGAGDWFGASLAFDGQLALIGAPGPSGFDSTSWKAGQAFVFRAGSRGDWAQEARLAPQAEHGIGWFGTAVLLDGPDALVGAPRADKFAGVVLRYRREGDKWAPAGRVTAGTVNRPAGFGAALARDGKDLLVGAPMSGQGAGAVHVLRGGPQSKWKEVQVLATQAVGFFSQLGAAIAAANGVAVAGAPLADFFEGTGFLYRRDGVGGAWRETAAVTDTASGALPAVVGGEVKCQGGRAKAFDCKDADLVAFLPNRAIGAKRGTLLNGIWGWTDSTTGREFALVGRTDGTSFVEVTNPANPKYLGDLPLHQGARANIWREIKVYKTYAFIVSDGAGPHGMQIFDLTQLRNVTTPQTFQETAHYSRINSAHNIVINPSSGFAYSVGNSMGGETCGGALHMVDIRDPLNPKFVGCYADPAVGRAGTGYTHDAQCVIYHGPDARYQGREICLTASETAVGIADVTDKAKPRTLSIVTYPNVSYAHQGWLSEDHRHFFLDDEGDELVGTAPKTRTVIIDVTDLEDPVVAKEFYGNTAATDHNLYVKGRHMYQSNYVAGLRVVDVNDPVNPVEVGYFDTVPFGENLPGFSGTWSNYPYFKNGVVAVSSMREGLFLIRYQPSTILP